MSHHRQICAIEIGRVLAASLIAFLGGVASAGCASPPVASPSSPADETPSAQSPDEAAPQDVDDVARELDRAEQQLWAIFEGAADDGSAADAGEPPPAPTQAGRPAPLHARGAVERRCAVACSALGSMQRSAGRLCAITGKLDERCVRADERVARASDQVRRSCPSC